MAADFKDVLRRRLVDSKGAVRKAAVVCLESFLLNQTGVTTAGEVSVQHEGERFCERSETLFLNAMRLSSHSLFGCTKVEMLGARCCDAGLSVRKQALISLHNVITQCSDDSAIIR
jgi:hypothetical protein